MRTWHRRSNRGTQTEAWCPVLEDGASKGHPPSSPQPPARAATKRACCMLSLISLFHLYILLHYILMLILIWVMFSPNYSSLYL